MSLDAFACTADLEDIILIDVQRAVSQSPWIFSGQVTELENLEGYWQRAVVIVDDHWKGNIGETVTVRAQNIGMMCITPLAEGKRFLFFGQREVEGEIDVTAWHASLDRKPELASAIGAFTRNQESRR